MIEETKICCRCHVQKPTYEFSKDKQKADGLRPNCRDCDHDKKYPNSERHIIHKCKEGFKYCPHCNEEIQLNEFSKHKNRKGGMGIWCKKCLKLYYDKISQSGICIDCGKPIHRKSIRCYKCNNLKRNREMANDPQRLEKFVSSMAKYYSDPEWIKKHSDLARNNVSLMNSLNKRNETLSGDPNWVERFLVGHTGEGFWYGNTTLKRSNNGVNTPLYCELFSQVDPRVRAFQGNVCLLCGKTERENGTRLNNHHVFYEKKTCCWIDENGEYWTNLNAKDHVEKDYYIGKNPNYFAMLCDKCHCSTNGGFENRKRNANNLRNIIDKKFGGKSYYTEEEMVENGYMKISKTKWIKL